MRIWMRTHWSTVYDITDYFTYKSFINIHFDCRIFTFINIFRDTKTKTKKNKNHALRNTGNTRISVTTASLSGRVYGFPPLLKWNYWIHRVCWCLGCTGINGNGFTNTPVSLLGSAVPLCRGFRWRWALLQLPLSLRLHHNGSTRTFLLFTVNNCHVFKNKIK